MIAYLNGTLISKAQNQTIIDVGGVGYMVGISTQTFSELPSTGSPVKLFIYHHFTESEQRLYGFLNTNEKNLFELLITVKSIGPKLALTMLSGMSAQQIVETIASQDAINLSRIPGIGKKTAERIVLELKDKLDTVVNAEFNSTRTQPVNRIADEAISALIALGYRKTDSERVVLQILRGKSSPENVSELIREALKSLNK